ncbi:MAG: hypothetical protein Kow0037_09030 [Calditrichia bacterium]
MKIAIIGTINQDLILPYNSGPVQSLGGIYYSLVAARQLTKSGTILQPISFVGEEFYPALLSLLEKLPGIDVSGFQVIPQRHHKVILEYLSEEERTEKALFNFPPLNWEQIQIALQADFCLVNLITGWDLELDAFLKLSEQKYSEMYLDVHFLVMGIDALGKRYPKKPENVEKWLRGARFIQMNEREFTTIAGEGVNEINFYDSYLNPDQVLLITRGSKGCSVLFRKENVVRKKDFPALPIKQIEDVTGCGDVFGAAFVAHYVEHRDVYGAVEFAQIAAGCNCLLKGTNELDKLKDLIKRVNMGESS